MFVPRTGPVQPIVATRPQTPPSVHKRPAGPVPAFARKGPASPLLIPGPMHRLVEGARGKFSTFEGRVKFVLDHVKLIPFATLPYDERGAVAHATTREESFGHAFWRSSYIGNNSLSVFMRTGARGGNCFEKNSAAAWAFDQVLSPLPGSHSVDHFYVEFTWPVILRGVAHKLEQAGLLALAGRARELMQMAKVMPKDRHDVKRVSSNGRQLMVDTTFDPGIETFFPSPLSDGSGNGTGPQLISCSWETGLRFRNEMLDRETHRAFYQEQNKLILSIREAAATLTP